MKKEQLTSLQSLRALAFLGIFLLHVLAPVDWGTLGVSVFFVMSGFLMYYTYYDRDLSLSLKDSFLFSIRKIKKLYPLHIITMLVACVRPMIYVFQSHSMGTFIVIVKKVIYNVLLIQTWIPVVDVNVSLNGVAWYLSVLLFLYITFPYILWIIKKLDRIELLVLLCVILYGLMYFVSILTLDKVGFDGQLFTWATYCFPVYRFGDFFMGAVLGYIFVNGSGKNGNVIVYTIIECLSLVGVCLYYIWTKKEHGNFYVRAISENYTFALVIFALVLTFLFAKSGGLITRALDNKVMIFLGDLSAYMFLIHYVVTQNIKVELISRGMVYTGLKQWIVIGIELLITILISLIYRYLERKVRA